MRDFLLGALAMGWWIAGLFFLRFWWDTKDRLFITFGMAFWILAVTRFALAWIGEIEEEFVAFVYWMRFAAFALILAAILQKNWVDAKKASSSSGWD